MKRLAGTIMLVAALLTGCGEDSGGAIDQTQKQGQEADGSFNDADVAFAQEMIPHHQQAVEMSDLAAERAESDEVKALAVRIKAAQAPEIEQMTGWLEAWDEPVEGAMGGMDMGDGGSMEGMEDMEGMEGMLSDDQIAELEAASGPDFDRLFLTGMRDHHAGAIMMAERVLEDGEFADAKQLARDIIATQQAEIEEIDGLLAA
ncbi:MAG TPA: DUF305 domain-containing protein [Acidimicrobiales bacterium]|nr:DUF305 domain-containing protein [Acidimicrobiales bacterium]